MVVTRALLAALLLGSISLGCDKAKLTGAGAADAAAPESPTPTSSSAEASAAVARKAPYEACDVLSSAIVGKVFPEVASATFDDADTLKKLDKIAGGELPKDKRPAAEFRREKLNVGLGSTCSYSWPKPDAAQIRERNAAKSQEMVKKALSKKKGGLAGGLLGALAGMESDRANVTLALQGQAPLETAAAAKSRYEERLAMVRKGFKGSNLDARDVTPNIDAGKAVAEAVKGIEIAPDDTLVAISGVGDGATWSEKSRTLYVHSGVHVFNVSVDQREDANRARAEGVAKAIVSAL